MLRLVVVVCVLLLLYVTTSSDTGFASHPFLGSGQLNINYLHSDFEAGGDRRITYRLCDDFQRGVPWQWGSGVEKWDSALGPTFEFDAVTSCSQATDGSALLRWGNPGACGANALACWHTYTNPAWYTAHGLHRDILLGLIIFETGDWDAAPNYRAYMPAHEFGHDLSLADHAGGNCAENTLMLNYTGIQFPPAPCGDSPTSRDIGSVRCVVYRVCKDTDFNGDGKSDAITFNTGGNAYVSLSAGSTFGSSVYWGHVFTWGEIPDTGDFNGDGKDDAVTFNTGGNAYVSLSSGSTFGSSVYWGHVFTWGEIPSVGDFNGDGKDDAITFNTAGDAFVSLSRSNQDGFLPAVSWGHVFYWSEIPGVGDFDGDGKSDAITFNAGGDAFVSISTGSTFGSGVYWGHVFTWGEIPSVGDFNGDGKDDAITFNTAGNAFVSLSRQDQNGFLPAASWGHVFYWSEIPGVGDFNGDGKSDAIAFSNAGNGWVALSTGSNNFGSSVYWGHVFTWTEIPGGFQPFAYEKIFDRWFGLW